MQAARHDEQRREPGVAGRQSGLAFFLATFSWRNKKKYARRSTAKTSLNYGEQPLRQTETQLSVADQRSGLSEPPGSAPDARAGFSDALLSAVDRRAYFLLLRQKKVAKEKATPGSAPGVARFLALLGRPGVWLNSPAARTTPADCPRPACIAQRLARGPEKHPYWKGVPYFLAFLQVDRSN